ncbi:hypothetical protein [Paenibacillus taichungensis]|uniref:hypothetical protein n=1 Tax=Paenibacillus taichungensis TaxID=484184 RepID=UPI0039A05E90
MKLAPTIRSHIEDYIKEKGYKLQQFSNTCGVNVGTLSAIIKGSRPLAMNQLDQITSALHNFDRLYPITINLERLAKIMMSHIKQDTTHTKRKTVYPLFVYQGYSLLLRASCCSKIGKYEEALECTRTYYELTLIEPNEEDILYIEKFRKWGKINIYLYRLMMGKNEVLEDYIEHVENEYEGEDEEILVAIFNIVQTANRFKYDVNFILERFKDKINLSHIGSRHEGEYSEQNWNTRLVKFFYELAVYYLSRSSYESGMKALISSMELSINISNDPYLIKCVNLYGEYRRFANEEINVKYQQILQSNNIA